ncbi:hypothetical protein BWI97_08685 [Siphonobacter sp. BAB-5405]|uniref:hypothetical protein n=1 Tax=Siphonobacter sp. BAB-5405 TaxID=1864825 RepID=UPI000C80EB9D|nr:hypothetical protein [Siphonobacter sp. BAB-5405]PMD97675.1 hypothetical protein BWI97_08685 [Siphonobacter sp. BAB-5405]
MSALPFDQQGSPVIPLNKISDLAAQEAEAQAMAAQANARLEQIAQQRERDRMEQENQLLKEYDGRLKDAKFFREEARQTTDPDEKRRLLLLAGQDEDKAREIAAQLGMNPAEVAPAEKTPWWQFTHGKMAIYQIIGIVLALFLCYNSFTGYQAKITEMNKSLPFDKQLQPYDETSIQKFFFEKLVQFSDLPTALIMVLLVVPFVGFYVLPIFGYGRNIWQEFKEEITAWERIKFTGSIILGFFLYLALSHLVKP